MATEDKKAEPFQLKCTLRQQKGRKFVDHQIEGVSVRSEPNDISSMSLVINTQSTKSALFIKNKLAQYNGLFPVAHGKNVAVPLPHHNSALAALKDDMYFKEKGKSYSTIEEDLDQYLVDQMYLHCPETSNAMHLHFSGIYGIIISPNTDLPSNAHQISTNNLQAQLVTVRGVTKTIFNDLKEQELGDILYISRDSPTRISVYGEKNIKLLAEALPNIIYKTTEKTEDVINNSKLITEKMLEIYHNENADALLYERLNPSPVEIVNIGGNTVYIKQDASPDNILDQHLYIQSYTPDMRLNFIYEGPAADLDRDRMLKAVGADGDTVVRSGLNKIIGSLKSKVNALNKARLDASETKKASDKNSLNKKDNSTDLPPQ